MTRFMPLLVSTCLAAAQSPPAPILKFAVAGDSRDCGDVVMPAIAAAVRASGGEFYWHLGDFRFIRDFDEDMAPPAALHLSAPHLDIFTYLTTAWQNFIDRQLVPFGDLEVFLGIGDHEVIYPMTRAAYVTKFVKYLDTPRLRAERDRDHDTGGIRTYYHWRMHDSIDFISLDNAQDHAFDQDQMAWLRTRLDEDRHSPAIRTIILGMHQALPGSKGMGHSMCDSHAGVSTGRETYNLLWDLQQSGKKVYVLASHSHMVMEDVYRTPYWNDRVLPGWIVGTSGAVRYRLPPGLTGPALARTDVYGYLLVTISSDGVMHCEFKEITLDDLRAANAGKTPDALVQWCYAENKDYRPSVAEACDGAH